MAAPKNSLLARCAVSSLDLAVRHWPESSRGWGQAVLAEMGEITEPAEAVSWAAGGMLLFLRALFSDFLEWLKLPAGGRLSGVSTSSGEKGPRLPKHSRLATAVVLVGAGALFFLPIGREAWRTVGASWQDFRSFRGDQRELERLGAKAEKEKDARELAFVALSYFDHDDRTSYFADRAVAIAPHLVWIYAAHLRRLDERADKGQLARLKNFDSDNAVVHLIAADAEGAPLIFHTPRGSDPIVDKRVVALTNDSKWLSEMDAAFNAARYDSYKDRRREIFREGWERKPALSPALAAMGGYLDFFPSMFELKAYGEMRVHKARLAAAAGHMDQAEKTIGAVTAFGERMSKETDASEFQQWCGLDLTRRGLEGLREIYAGAGRQNEAEAVASQIRDIDATTTKLRQDFPKYHKEDWQASEKRAVLVHVSSILAAFLAVAILISLCILELSSALLWQKKGARRTVACQIVNYGPVLFLAATVTFLISFEPFATALQQYRSANLSRIELRSSSIELDALQGMNPLSYFSESSSDYFLWMVATVLLSGIALIVIVRGMIRRKKTLA
jgi:hypothetical protein